MIVNIIMVNVSICRNQPPNEPTKKAAAAKKRGRRRESPVAEADPPVSK